MAKKVNDISKIGELFDQEITVLDKDTGDEKTFKTVDRAEVCTIVAYMLGVNDEVLERYYGARYAGNLEQLRKDKAATVIRYLNRIRTTLLQNFLKVDNALRFELKNLDRIEFFHTDEIKQLQKWGIQVVQANYRSEKYSELLCKLIDQNIDACQKLFPEYVKFRYIRELFVVPKYEKTQVLVDEYNKYKGNKNLYPFQAYMYWQPEEKGYILASDTKFLGIIYSQHGDFFYEPSKTRDAVEETKQDIYSYIDSSKNVVMVVDCENSDPYKLYGVLKNLNATEVEQIKKIILYDDYHTTMAWDFLSKLIHIPVEHVEVERVAEHKSLVDISMAVGVSKEFYENDIDSFILCSSDSDFWGLISSLDKARYLVLYEYQKCGNAIKDALASRGIYHCSIDDFYQGNATDLEKIVLRRTLEKYLPDIIGENGWELTKRIYGEAYINASQNDMKNFYDRYVKTLRLKVDEEGRFRVVIAD